jgi:CheY-like chemotaxis protein
VEGPQLSAIRASLQRVREELSPVLSGTARIATITRDLRTFNRSDDSSAVPTDVRAVIDSVVKLVSKEVEARATLVLGLEDTPAAMANETRLVQVVLNLIMNAIQALPLDASRSNRIEVRNYADDAWVVIEVIDSGAGIPMADRERIFDPFYTTKEIGKGTGLGLFVCRNIVRGFSGDVVVVDAPEGGALFRVTLPRGSSEPVAVAKRRPSLASTVGRHVVLIDDDAIVLRALSAQLSRAGFRVTTFDDGAAALQSLASETNVDLIFCDLMMKGMTGMDVGADLTTSAPELARKLVFMTGGAFSAQAQDFVAQNADRTVNKPFDIIAEARRRLT